jgi:fatty acid desaturase
MNDRTGTPWRRRDVPRELLAKPTIAGLVRQALVEWALLALCWTAMAFAPWWADVALMVLVAGRLHALGVILHDATHLPLKAKGPLTRVLEVLVAYPIATTLEAMRYHHLRHHRDSGMASDPYFKPGASSDRKIWLVQWLRGLLLMPFWSVRAPFGLVASLVPALRPAYARVFLQDRSGADARTLRTSREVINCARAELGQVLFQLPLVAAFVLWPEVMAWYYVLPATLTGLLASYRVLCEHHYEPTHERSVATLLRTTRDHHLGLAGAVLFAPRNIGFHIVHHIHPQVAQEHLPALRRWYLDHHHDYPAAPHA